MPTFKGPTVDEGITGPGLNRLVARYKLARGETVINYGDGKGWQTVRFPWNGDLTNLTDGVDYFLGGHTYTITTAQATDLTNAGYGAYIT